MLSSASNAQIRKVIQLNQKSRLRRELGLFVAEGIKMFQEAPVSLIDQVFISESLYAQDGWQQTLRKIPYQVVTDALFRQMSDTRTPQGILTVLKTPVYTWDALLSSAAPLLVVLENVQDPGNVGTILRTAEGAGADGVILSRGCADLQNPKTVRATMGSIYRVPFLYTEQLTAAMQQLHSVGVQLVAASLRGEQAYTDIDCRKGTAFLIGNEANGLGDASISAADRLVRIPLQGRVESLNAAMACGILLYEAVRQRT